MDQKREPRLIIKCWLKVYRKWESLAKVCVTVSAPETLWCVCHNVNQNYSKYEDQKTTCLFLSSPNTKVLRTVLRTPLIRELPFQLRS
jgi:hypothetical protein